MKAKHLMMALAIMAVLCLGLSGCQTKNERIALVADGAVQLFLKNQLSDSFIYSFFFSTFLVIN